MFAKTFDIVYENRMQEYLFKFAERTIEWRNAPGLPPPLNVVVDLLRTVQWLLGKLGCPFVKQPVQPEETDPFDLNSFLDILEPKVTREEWRKEVLEDFEENSDFGSDSQMEKFKSTILKRSKKLESVLEQQVTQAKTLQSLELKLESIKGSQEKKLESLEAMLLKQDAMLLQQQAMLQQLLTNAEVRMGSGVDAHVTVTSA
jgi:hypothetical protein